MKPNEFVKDYGIERTKQLVNADHTVHALIFAIEKVSFLDLKRLLESHKLVDELGGLESCKKKIETRDKCRPSASYFSIHPSKPHLIQLYIRNQVKLVPNYSFKDLMQAISDVESCQ